MWNFSGSLQVNICSWLNIKTIDLLRYHIRIKIEFGLNIGWKVKSKEKDYQSYYFGYNAIHPSNVWRGSDFIARRVEDFASWPKIYILIDRTLRIKDALKNMCYILGMHSRRSTSNSTTFFNLIFFLLDMKSSGIENCKITTVNHIITLIFDDPWL